MAPKNQRFWLTTDEVSTVIDAPAEQLYDMVADMPRMGEWSRECATVEWTERGWKGCASAVRRGRRRSAKAREPVHEGNAGPWFRLGRRGHASMGSDPCGGRELQEKPDKSFPSRTTIDAAGSAELATRRAWGSREASGLRLP